MSSLNWLKNLKISITNPKRLELNRLISKAYQSFNGLYPHEILMLSDASNHCEGCTNKDFCGYWFYKYHVTNPKQILDSLFDRGFIRYANLKEHLNKAKILDLKRMLVKYGMIKTGKKATLIQRLMEGVSPEVLLKEFPKKIYALTEKGKKELQDNSYILLVHRKDYDMDIWQINILKHEHPNCPVRDLIWGNYNKLLLEHIKNFDFGLYGATKYRMASFLMEENKYENALPILSEAIFYELSGLSNNCNPNNIYSFVKISRSFWFPYKKSIIKIPPAFTKMLVNIKEKLDLSDEQLEKQLINEFRRFKLFFQIFTSEECSRIVMSELNKDIGTIEKIFDVAEKRLEKTLKNKLGKAYYNEF